MRFVTKDFALTALWIILGLVVLQQSCVLAFSADAQHRAGLPEGVRLALAWTEIVAAVLFLVPRTFVMGGVLLVAVFLAAMGIHLLHGEFGVGGLLVYTAATLALLAHRQASIANRPATSG